jgi:predicted ATP-grasp superfamily ATP-dependent carboligase
MAPVVVLSGHLAAMGTIRCLGVAKLPVVNVYYADSDFSHTSRHVTHRIRSPHPEVDERGFVQVLVDCARRFGRCLLVPANDATLGVVSRRKAELEVHHTVACADWSIVEKVIDKKHTYALAHAIGIPAPRTEIPQSKADLERIAAALTFPCLVKPRESHRYAEVFRAKLARVRNAEELRVEYDRATSVGIGVMVQEYVPGDDSHSFNYNSYHSQGRFIDFTAQKLRLAPPEFGLPRVVVSRDVPEIVAPARRILQELGYTGYSCTEFKLDPRDGVYKLLEVNGRVNRSILHPLGCGINFPWMMYRDLVLGEAVSTPVRSADPVYWIDLASDVRYSARGWKAEGYGLEGYLRPYRGRKVFAVGDGMDVMPFLKRSLETFETRLRKLGNSARERLLRAAL